VLIEILFHPGNVGALLCYYTSTTDPDGDQIKYTFDWDDGDNSETEFVASGTRVGKCHSWGNEGTYEVRVKATDEEAKSSEWSDPMIVTITKP
jgi:hypothetical protein